MAGPAAVPDPSLFWRAPRASSDDETIIEVAPRIPGFRLIRLIGRGRNTRAWLAWDLNRHVDLVLKLEADPGASLQREASVAARAQGPRLVRVLGQGRTAAWSWLAMEHVPGGNLAMRMGQPVPREQALSLLRQAAEALAQLHRIGLVHRDVKPANFLLREDGNLVLGDFGLAVETGALDEHRGTGALYGTPRYVAPEQLQGAPAHSAADVYSLGVLFFELLCGRPPFPGATLEEVLAQHLLAVPARLPAALADLQPLVDRMLCKQEQSRLRNADAVLGLTGQR
jgi:serine/threonine protein kinase